jgi:hypothetical protein
MTLKTFMPSGADTVSLAVTTASTRVALDVNSRVVRVVNDGTATAFIQFGDSNVTANTAKMPIKAGATETFTTGTASHVAAVTASGTTNMYFTNGEGL